MRRNLGNFIKLNIIELIGLNKFKISSRRISTIISIKIYISVIESRQLRQSNSLQKQLKNINQ